MTKRYLGTKGVSDVVTASISIGVSTNTEMKALHDFWVFNCNYGIDPFVIPLPILGATSASTIPYDFYLVEFINDQTSSKIDYTWDVKRSLKILNEVTVVLDDNDNIIIDDSGNIVIADATTSNIAQQPIDSYRKVLYGYPKEYTDNLEALYPALDLYPGSTLYPRGAAYGPSTIIPIYDSSTLPLVSLPFGNTVQSSNRYLGHKAMTRSISATLNIKASNNLAINNLNKFWEEECNYGLEPFLISLPMFGRDVGDKPDILVKFIGDTTQTKSKASWEAKQSISILGFIDYTINGDGSFVLSTSGQFVLDGDSNYVAVTDNLHINKEISYGNS